MTEKLRRHPQPKPRTELPLDIIYNILLHLPVKSLSRLRCVSKPWNSTISNPMFKKHHHGSQNNPLLLLATQSGSIIRLSTYTTDFTRLSTFTKTIPIPPEQIDYISVTIHPVGSCLGLVCLASGYRRHFLVCNPSTQELSVLPPPPVKGYYRCAGFGYAASTGQFKVIRYFNSGELGQGEDCCEILTLDTVEGWRKASNPPPPFVPRCRAPLLHGAIHLVPLRSYQHGCDHYVAAFDIDTEEYRRISLPEIYFQEPVFLEPQLAELKESLCLPFDFLYTKGTLELWLLKDYKNGKWAKEYNIDFSFSIDYLWPYPVATMGDGRILLNVNFMEEGYELFCYNTNDNCFTHKIRCNYSAILYSQSLLTLGTGTSERPRLDSGKYVTYDISGGTKELRILKKQLKSELEMVRRVSRRIESMI